MSRYYPSITILTSTLNPNKKTFLQVLESVKQQKYPNKIEHILLDGGSKKETIAFAKEKYGCQIYQFNSSIFEGAYRAYKGLQAAGGEFILILESDNILTSSDWLTKMVHPFIHKNVFATFPAYNAYFADMSLFTKYAALIGSPDPTLFYLKKSDKIPVTYKRYDKGTILQERKDYYIVQFTQDTLPTVGDNGYLVKKEVLQRVIRKNKPYIHVDAFAELLLQGYDTYGVVKNSIIHVARSDVLSQVRRRIEVKENFYNRLQGRRTYLVYNPQSPVDRKNLRKYIFFSLTFFEPFLFACKGYSKIRDRAWFLHPIICFLMVCGYGLSEIRQKVILQKPA